MAARSFIYPATVRLAEDIKKRLPETKIILGGHHASLVSETTEFPECFDTVVRHEGEQAFVDLMKMFEKERSGRKSIKLPT